MTLTRHSGFKTRKATLLTCADGGRATNLGMYSARSSPQSNRSSCDCCNPRCTTTTTGLAMRHSTPFVVRESGVTSGVFDLKEDAVTVVAELGDALGRMTRGPHSSGGLSNSSAKRVRHVAPARADPPRFHGGCGVRPSIGRRPALGWRRWPIRCRWRVRGWASVTLATARRRLGPRSSTVISTTDRLVPSSVSHDRALGRWPASAAVAAEREHVTLADRTRAMMAVTIQRIAFPVVIEYCPTRDAFMSDGEHHLDVAALTWTTSTRTSCRSPARPLHSAAYVRQPVLLPVAGHRRMISA